ncbi:PAS domain S-box protein [bacterium]|nr:PAS domain S-box protein [bacterium]
MDNIHELNGDKFKLLFNAIFDAFFIIDIKGNIIDVNPQAIKNLGFSREELLNMHVSDIEKGNVPEQISILIKNAIDGKKALVEGIHQRKDCTTFPIEASIVVFQEKNPTLLLAIIRDISKRKATEEKLREKTNFLNRIINDSAISMGISDSNGTAIRFNHAAEKLFNIKEKEIVGKYNLFKDEELISKGLLPVIDNLFKTGKPDNLILEYDMNNLEHVDLERPVKTVIKAVFTPIKNKKGQLSNIVVQHVDLSSEKNAEVKAIKSEERFRKLFDQLPIGLTMCKIIKDEDGKPFDFLHLQVNKAAKKHTGRSPKQLIGKLGSEIYSRRELKIIVDKFISLINGAPPIEEEFLSPVFNRMLKLCTSHLIDNIFVISCTDISEQKTT